MIVDPRALTPDQIMARLEVIDSELADIAGRTEFAADSWFRAKRDRERQFAEAFIEAKAQGRTVAESEAIATEQTCTVGLEAEAKFEALKAVTRVLETRASIGQSLLRAHTQGAGWQPSGPQPRWTREAAEAERDRLAQELEDAVEAMRKAARGPSPASAVTGFLARFPVKEGDA